jgi:hypothetical protein
MVKREREKLIYNSKIRETIRKYIGKKRKGIDEEELRISKK